jgi:fructuronate reductase
VRLSRDTLSRLPALGRPDWEKTGVTLVADVAPYAAMKLRLLNGSHSTIAYLGLLAGWQTLADAMAEPALVAHIEALMLEMATTLDVRPGMDVAAYCKALIARFGNPTLRHLTAQIARNCRSGSSRRRSTAWRPGRARGGSRSALPPGCAFCRGAPRQARRSVSRTPWPTG